jgi:nitrite reductase (cytochrome c-552)
MQAAAALHKKAQWRLDFVAAENSMGFHAPQEMARILAEAIDFARQGQAEADRVARKR